MTSSLRVSILLLALLLSACSTGGSPTSSPTQAPSPVATAAGQAAVPTGQPAATRPAPTAAPTSAPTSGPTAATTAPGAPTAKPTSAPTAAATAVSGQDAQFDAIAREVSKLRGLPLESDVREDYLTRDQLRERLKKQIDEEYKPGEVEADERVLKAFGLAPADLDLRKLYVDLYSGQIAGLYDPETKRMYVVSSGKKLNALGQLTYAHEVTHALQDQHFDLEKLTNRAEKLDDDASLALQGLVEGDATVLQYGDYLRSKPELQGAILDAITQEQENAQLPENVPPIIQQTLLFPYEQGAVFVTTVRGGIDSPWQKVDAAYKDPPTSTEQILHPEKYLGARDEPTQVQVPDLAPALGPGWKKLEENLFGEFQTRVLLEGQLSPSDAEDAAKGWDGDEFALYTKGNQEVVGWESVWDSDRDAEEFAAALRSYDEKRFGGTYSDQGGTYTLAANGKAAAIRQEGNRVHYALAPSQELARRVLAALAR